MNFPEMRGIFVKSTGRSCRLFRKICTITTKQEGETEEDVEEIKSQIHSVKQDSVNSTQRSLRLIQEAQNSGEKTLNKLGEQTQRINYTENKLELAEIHAQRAADNASKLKKASFKII
ncbi:6010_t:CDS:2 [Entrophospora sp. SA101]|nr:6010_t:CDS:2 [Entrophospora sp. SA101]CAJ0917645.1 16976_t:CDS:2 [Entrophospora sp. SA101]